MDLAALTTRVADGPRLTARPRDAALGVRAGLAARRAGVLRFAGLTGAGVVERAATFLTGVAAAFCSVAFFATFLGAGAFLAAGFAASSTIFATAFFFG